MVTKCPHIDFKEKTFFGLHQEFSSFTEKNKVTIYQTLGITLKKDIFIQLTFYITYERLMTIN